MFQSSNEANSYAVRATQAGEVPTEEPNAVCPTTTGQKGLSRSAISALPGLGIHHSHTRKNNVDSKPEESSG